MRTLLTLASAAGLIAMIASGLWVTVPATAQDTVEEGPLPFDAVPADAASPFGGMAITPTRLALNAGGRGTTVTLYNSSDAAVTYRVELVELGLDAAGNYRALVEGESAEWSAAQYLRFSPRQVTLQPGERQSVRVIARAPRNLPAGELRSHMQFSSIPLVEGASEGEDERDEPADGDRKVSIKVGLDYRVTIPVLLRTGMPDGGTAIRTVIRSPDDPNIMKVVLERTGQRSDYGTLRALDAAGVEVGILRGISVLPPAATRTVNLTLRPGKTPARLVFEEQVGTQRTGERLTEFNLP